MSNETSAPEPLSKTHAVFNQVPGLEGYNPYLADLALREAVVREGAVWAEPRLIQHGSDAGSAAVIKWGFDANENPPRLKSHDRFGNRVDQVEFHPSWHELLNWSMRHEVHSLPWTSSERGSAVARAGLLMLSAQVDAGHCCPISMATACVSTLRHNPELAAAWTPKVTATRYDSRFIPMAQKSACLIGMAMTEKQGGSDVRANATVASPAGAVPTGGGAYAVRGHKWFCSAPMCDAFLILAQAPEGLSCFLLPRLLPDGSRNNFLIQRLKDKLGNCSNASSEVEFDNSLAWRVGEEGHGVRTIIEMVNHTRLDCALISTAIMRLGLVHAVHHARHRAAFGRKLVEHELMQNTLAQLSVESEAATALVMRLARSYDRKAVSEPERLFARLVTTVAKYWICKRAPSHVFEAMECLGGAGYVEESILPRLYREAPLNSIWEGSGNVMCLDVLRALRTEPATVDAFLAEVGLTSGADSRLDAAVGTLKEFLLSQRSQPADGRRLVELMARTLQGSLLVRSAPAAVAEVFCATLAPDAGHAFGTLNLGRIKSPGALQSIIDRALVS
jgi:putative acyl-CoA dehydrogenase